MLIELSCFISSYQQTQTNLDSGCESCAEFITVCRGVHICLAEKLIIIVNETGRHFNQLMDNKKGID